jgi:beta-glucosidase
VRAFVLGTLSLVFFGVPVLVCDAQTPASLPYRNPTLNASERASDLVGRLSLQEKVSQLVNQSRAVPRLGIPAYDWWSEALHGVAVNAVTEFPEPVGLAATFDVPGIHEMATAIGVEGRIKHARVKNQENSRMFEGLDFWAPNVNIFRDPRWGRGQETYGEDPFLSARLAVAYVTGLQGDDPHYYRAIATPKHFAVHSGPEPTRHFADVDVSKHDIEDTYLPAFRAAIVEGKAGSIMCAYNAINGEPACASQFLLEHTLRTAWQFQGYVVSDCEAVRNIFSGHHYQPSQAQASALALTRGMDNECIDFGDLRQDDQDYRPYLEAVEQGYLAESSIDAALKRLFTARIRLGLFDPPSLVPFTKLDPAELEGSAHHALAERLAEESMVLLKNDGVLPLRGVKRIALVGPLAAQTLALLGNYNGNPSHTVSVLEGMKAEFPSANVSFLAGTQFLATDAAPIPASHLTSTSGARGLTAQYVLGTGKTARVALERTESTVNLQDEAVPAEVRRTERLRVRWSGLLHPSESGEYLIGLKAEGAAKLTLDGRKIVEMYGPNTDMVPVHLESNHPLPVEVEYTSSPDRPPAMQLLWTRENNAPDPSALAAASEADVIVAVVGLTSRLEGEEMPVNRPGFSGGDRTSLDLPKPEQDLLEALSATGKPLVVVLLNGSALGIGWAKSHASAILEAWYPGQAGGTAVAKTLSGSNNPAGRLPVTFYRDVHQLPQFEDYSMTGRTYRYFKGEPLWPFGFGLSYTSFEYRDVALSGARIAAGDSLDLRAMVRNTGTAAGDEVVQLYLKFPSVAGAPLVALRGFQRLHLEPNQSRQVEFRLTPRDLSVVNEIGDIIVAAGTYSVSIGGGQPGTSAATIGKEFDVRGQIILPE